MDISKELLKKEEEYTEIQHKLGLDMTKILAVYTKYREHQDSLPLNLSNIQDLPRHSDLELQEENHLKTEITRNIAPPKEKQKSGENLFADRTHAVIRKFQEQISSLKNELSSMKMAHDNKIETCHKLKVSKDKLASDIIKLNNQNNSLRNNLRDKELLCTDQIRKFEALTSDNQNMRKELEKTKNDLRAAMMSENLQKNQICRIKKSYETLQQESKQNKHIHKEELEANKTRIKDYIKRIQDQDKLMNEVISGLGQQQLYIENLQRQCNLLVNWNLSEVSESSFRELLKLYMPDNSGS